MEKTLRGRCLCGAVEYQIPDTLEYAGYCHCSECRRFSGSAFSAFRDAGSGLAICLCEAAPPKGQKARLDPIVHTMSYDVFLNLRHDTMGNWGKIHKRFCCLSEGGRYVIYTTNNKTKSCGSAISVCRDGKKVLAGDSAIDTSLPEKYLKTNDWRLVTLPLKCG